MSDEQQRLQRVMVIDDSPSAGQMAKSFFQKLGIECMWASSAVNALGNLVRCRPDIIFIDADMPRVSGFDACAILAENEESRGIPLFILSGTDNHASRIHGEQSGARGFLEKPLDEAKLEAALSILQAS